MNLVCQCPASITRQQVIDAIRLLGFEGYTQDVTISHAEVTATLYTRDPEDDGDDGTLAVIGRTAPAVHVVIPISDPLGE